jgi:hemin uptake protein HemP
MKPQRNPRYLAWIRTQPCCVCGSRRGIEASHTGPHGLGQKSPDSSAIPLCRRHHRTGDDSYHRLGPRKFAQIHNLDIPAMVRRLNTKPLIRVESGLFVAHLEGQQYVLGKTEVGIHQAVRKMVQLCGEDRLAQEIAS